MAELLNRGDAGVKPSWRDGLEDFLAQAFIDGGPAKSQAIISAGGKVSGTHITRRRAAFAPLANMRKPAD